MATIINVIVDIYSNTGIITIELQIEAKKKKS